MHAGTALPGNGAAMDGRVSIEKGLDCILGRSRCHWSEVLASKLRPISAAADAGVSAQPYLSSEHDCSVVGNKLLTICTVLCDDGISRLSRGTVGLVAGTVTIVNLEQTLTNRVGTEVAHTVASPANGGGGTGMSHHPRMGEDLLDGDPGSGTRV